MRRQRIPGELGHEQLLACIEEELGLCLDGRGSVAYLSRLVSELMNRYEERLEEAG